jgi:O-methyltransferase involved in polyketide biosynthesis
VDNGHVRWLTVDLPETVAVRERLLPADQRQTVIARSAFDLAWTDEVDAARGVLVTAQGLFMYFELDEVVRVVDTCAHRLPGGTLVFDTVPRWLSEASRKGNVRQRGYQPPPWLWGIDRDKRRRLRAEPLRLERGRGWFGALAPILPPTIFRRRL